MDLITLAKAKQYTNSQRLAWVEPTENPVYPAAVFTRGEIEINDGAKAAVFYQTESLKLEAGKTYIVHLDNRVYTSVCRKLTHGSLELGPAIGNFAMVTGETEDTGEPYVYYEMDMGVDNNGDPEGVAGNLVDMLLAETCYIAEPGEDIVHQIDEKYIPNKSVGDRVIPDCITLDAPLPSEAGTEVALSESESALLTQIIGGDDSALHIPIIGWGTEDGLFGYSYASITINGAAICLYFEVRNQLTVSKYMIGASFSGREPEWKMTRLEVS